MSGQFKISLEEAIYIWLPPYYFNILLVIKRGECVECVSDGISFMMAFALKDKHRGWESKPSLSSIQRDLLLSTNNSEVKIWRWQKLVFENMYALGYIRHWVFKSGKHFRGGQWVGWSWIMRKSIISSHERFGYKHE